MKRVLFSLICALCIFSQAVTAEPVGTLKKESVDNFDTIKVKQNYKSYGVDGIDISDNMPVVDSQGQQGSCASWATGYYLQGFYQAQDNGWVPNISRFSPAFLYNQIKKGATGGTSFGDNLEIMKNMGVCRWRYMPYNPLDSATQPSTAALADASLFKIADYGVISNDGINPAENDVTSMKNWLDRGEPLVIGVPIDVNDFNTLGPNNPVYDTILQNNGGHALTLVGYADDMQAFKFVNSWGVDWGFNGYGWISYDMISTKCAQFGWPQYGVVIADIDGANIPYDDPVKKKYLQHTKRTCVSNKIGSQLTYSVKTTTGLTLPLNKVIYTTANKVTIKVTEDDPKYDDTATVTKTLVDGMNIITVTVKERTGKTTYSSTKKGIWKFYIMKGAQ